MQCNVMGVTVRSRRGSWSSGGGWPGGWGGAEGVGKEPPGDEDQQGAPGMGMGMGMFVGPGLWKSLTLGCHWLTGETRRAIANAFRESFWNVLRRAASHGAWGMGWGMGSHLLGRGVTVTCAWAVGSQFQLT